MKRVMLGLALATSALIAVPAQATILLNGSSLVPPTPGVPAGQGSLLASQVASGQSLTFAAIFNQAVYRNAMGTLDFYYQVLRTGAGSLFDNEIRSFTVNPFGSYTVDGFASGPDPDGAGIFIAAANPALANGTLSPSTTTFGRSPSGDVITTEFGLNGLTGTENSATYIFRTNATQFDGLGTFGIINGSTIQGQTYRPVGAPIPEPATWAMMILGFGFIGGVLRRRRATTVGKPRVRYSFS